MKADINAEGRLTIRAETDLENYALTKWWGDWNDHKVVLNIEVQHETNPNTKTFKQVKNADG